MQLVEEVIEKFAKLGLDFSPESNKRKMTLELGEPTPEKLPLVTEINGLIEYGQVQININCESGFPIIKLDNFDSDYSNKLKKITLEFEEPKKSKKHYDK